MRNTLIALSVSLAAGLLPALAGAQTSGAGPGAESGGAQARDPGKMAQALAQRFKKADANGDGKLTLAEAQAGMPRVAKDFNAIDTNGDGFVTPAEIRAAMAARRAAGKGAPAN